MWNYWAGDCTDLQISQTDAYLCTGGVHPYCEDGFPILPLMLRELAECVMARRMSPTYEKKARGTYYKNTNMFLHEAHCYGLKLSMVNNLAM